MNAHAHAGDQEYEAFPSVAPRNGLQERVELPCLLAALAPPAGARVLEIGCGQGIALPVIARRLRPTSLTAVDIDPLALGQAEARVRFFNVSADVRHADVRALPFADASFDVVFDFGTCYHIAKPERALAEIARVLCWGGIFVTETVASQFLAHPIRTRGRALPWDAVPELVLERHAILWQSRRKHTPRSSQ